ncbi:unnamed protein product [Acanthoscelides obtectus]|uniref:C2H2-type domain-containing protein n=1 Tax=Acanthoscelides obtectus TaxID=200917 RepID=A0A9P0LHR6_ACAOB|nr:unnamed protein product [Acanthoscelides obtectus]CAK1675661.1 Zinc finger protein 320 [Acanthoscelides obtectus]
MNCEVTKSESDVALKKFECDLCGKLFKQRSGLTAHQKEVHIKALNYTCDECGMRFVKKFKLTRHIRQAHSQESKLFCPHCEAGFGETYFLREHIRVRHENMRYSCQECGKEYESRCGLISHMSLHRNEKYRCALCEKVCPNKQQLRRHKCVKVNTYPCNKCGKEFTAKKHMVAHKRTTIECNEKRRYHCQRCGEQFTAKTKIANHIRQEHQPDPKIPYCKLEHNYSKSSKQAQSRPEPILDESFQMGDTAQEINTIVIDSDGTDCDSDFSVYEQLV